MRQRGRILISSSSKKKIYLQARDGSAPRKSTKKKLPVYKDPRERHKNNADGDGPENGANKSAANHNRTQLSSHNVLEDLNSTRDVRQAETAKKESQ